MTLTSMGWLRRAARLAGICAVAWALAGCDENSFDRESQIGSDPKLPEPQQYLLPPFHIASVVGWRDDEKPTVAAGLKVEAIAKGLEHPRSLYVLPNGDVLVVESKAPETHAAYLNLAQAMLRCAEAESNAGHNAEANDEARRAWLSGITDAAAGLRRRAGQEGQAARLA